MTDAARPRISVINDNADFLELMSAILDDDAGYDVTLFNGESTRSPRSRPPIRR